jgi:hypothetical protein
MGNDNQVKDVLQKTKSVFLPESIENPDGKPRLYSLDDEFSKTRKNKPFLLYLFVTGFIVLIVSISFIIILFIQNKNKNVSSLDLKEFKDMKLKELIDASKKNENKIDQAKREISELDTDYRDKLDKINRDYERRHDELAIRDMSEEDRKVQMSALDKDKGRRVQVAESEYITKKKQKEAQIIEVQKKLNADSGKVDKSDKRIEDIFGGEGKIQSLQMKKVSSEYDAKLRDQKEEARKDREELILLYNPIYKEKYVLEVISKPVSDVKAKDKYFVGLDDDIALEKVATKEQLAKLSDDMKKELAITGRLRQTPYKNSAQRSVLHSDSLTKQIFNTYDLILQKMVGVIQGKNQALKYYGYAFEYMTRSQQENGYILDARDPKKIGVFLGKVLKVNVGDVAYVFRSDDEFIATIRFKNYQGLVVGEVVEVVPGRDIRPFDKLMFKMGSEQQ